MLADKPAPAAAPALSCCPGTVASLLLTLSVATPASPVARAQGPAAGFPMLGVDVSNNLLFPPVAALGVAEVAGAVVPGLPPVPVTVAIMAGATLVGVLDVRLNAVVTGVFLAVEAAALGVVTLLGARHPVRGWEMLLHPVATHGHALVPASAASIGVATSIAIFALNGYGSAVYFGKEMLEAPTRIARAILLALAAALALESVPVAAALAAAPDFGGFVAATGGHALGGCVAAGVVVAIVNAVIAGILSSASWAASTSSSPMPVSRRSSPSWTWKMPIGTTRST